MLSFKNPFKLWTPLFVRLSLFFAVSLIIIFLLNRWVAGVFDAYDREKFRELTNPQENAEAVIFGASRAFSGINPRQLENVFPKIYNFAIPGLNRAGIKSLYTLMFKKYHPKPRFIIMSVELRTFMTPGKFEGNSLERFSEYFPFQFFLRQLAARGVDRTSLVLNRFPIVKYRMEILHALFGLHYILNRYNAAQFYKGYVPMNMFTDQVQAVKTLNQGWTGYQNDAASPDRLAELSELIQLFRSENIPVIYVILPDYRPAGMVYEPSPEAAAVKKTLAPHIDGKTGFLIDFNYDQLTGINSDPVNFHDGMHLSLEGSVKFTEALNKEVTDIYLKLEGARLADAKEYQAVVHLADLYSIAQNFSKAKTYYETAVKMDPKNAEAHEKLADLLFNAKKYDLAETVYKKALSIKPEDANLWLKIGDNYVWNHQYNLAETAYVQASKIDPNWFQPYYNLATIYMATNHLRESIPLYLKTIELKPDMAAPYDYLSKVYLALNEPQNAEEIRRRAEEFSLKN